MKRFFPSAVATFMLLVRVAFAAESAPSTPREQADFLAGLPLPESSSLAALQKSPTYQIHVQELNQQWARCKKSRYDAMQKWGEEHLKSESSTRDVVRYLFGGPDFLNAFAFFPDARVIVLGGLEPVGEVPPPESLKSGEFSGSLASLRHALRTSFACGYFITKDMGGELRRGAFKGVLPVLFTELALTGNSIESVELVSPFGSPGARIAYSRPGQASQTLYYFQADLSDGKCQRFLTWLGELGSGPAYLKAASYLLHNDSFSQTRDFLLKTSTLVVEDDSGIPFRHFNNAGWTVRVFGAYTPPIPVFSGYKQRDFSAAYRTEANAGAITFGVGYHVRPHQANLLLAKRNDRTNESTPPPDAAQKLSGAQNNPPHPTAQQSAEPEPTDPINPAAQPGADPTRKVPSKSLAELETDELGIRNDASLTRRKRMVLLAAVWRKQLEVMGKMPDSSGKTRRQ